MKHDEKLLREYIKESLHTNSLNEAMTVGDFKQAIEYIKKTKNVQKAKEIAKSAGKSAASAVLGLIPGGGTMVQVLQLADTLGSAVADAYSAAKDVDPKEKKSNPFLDFLSVDPDTSAIVDDKLEDDFTKELIDRVRLLDDEDELPGADQQLTNWLKNKFNQAHVAK